MNLPLVFVRLKLIFKTLFKRRIGGLLRSRFGQLRLIGDAIPISILHPESLFLLAATLLFLHPLPLFFYAAAGFLLTAALLFLFATAFLFLTATAFLFLASPLLSLPVAFFFFALAIPFGLVVSTPIAVIIIIPATSATPSIAVIPVTDIAGSPVIDEPSRRE